MQATKRRRANRTTKATRGKLERALVQLESFIDADDFEEVTTSSERTNLRTALRTIQDLESQLYNGGRA